jgi:nitric oxide reductase activation protein
LANRSKSLEPPAAFGAIRPRDLLAAVVAQTRDDHNIHDPLRKSTEKTAELDEDDEADDGDGPDPFSSPVGGGGAIGKLLQRMLRRVRQLGEGGSPGADTPTHRTRDGLRGRSVVTSTATAAADADDTDGGEGFKYPEWDAERKRYRRDWCTVLETDPPRRHGHSLDRPDVHALRRPLTRLGIGLDRAHRQAQGDDIDVDAAVEARVELLAGSAPDEAVYLDNLRRRRDLAVLVLLDISGSSSEAGTLGKTVHEQQRATAAALTVALHQLGDRVALYAYQSQGRNAVHMLPVKQFDENLDVTVMQRLGSLTPGAYSRLGAAIRHGSAVISEKAGTSRRLLVVVSDGLAYDHGYERAYGAADARRALGEARRRGIGCLCLTIGAGTDTGELARVFGSAAYASIPRPERVADVVGPLFRAGLRSADLRRKVS